MLFPEQIAPFLLGFVCSELTIYSHSSDAHHAFSIIILYLSIAI